MSGFSNLKRQSSRNEHDDDNDSLVNSEEENKEIILGDEEEETGGFSLEPTYKAMGLPDSVGDVIIDDGFNFRDERTRGIDFLRPLAHDIMPTSMDTNSSLLNTLQIDRDYKEPPRLPIDLSLFPLENTHFLTNAKPVDICEEFSKAFESTNVKITNFNINKYKFKCEFNVPDENGKTRERVSFRARIYTVNKDKKYVVELQRRDGCCMEWRKLYHNLKQNIPLDKIVQ